MAGIDFNTLTPEARRKALEQMSPAERAKFDAAGPIPPRKKATAAAPASAGKSGNSSPKPAGDSGEPSTAPPVPQLISKDVTSRGDGFGALVGLAILFVAFMWLDNQIKPTLLLAVAVIVGIGAIFPPLAIGILAIAFLYVFMTHGLPVIAGFQDLFSKANKPRSTNPILPRSSGTQAMV